MAEMMSEEDIYIKLREFLQGFPVGFPVSESGMELEILRRIFTPDEALVEMHVRQAPEAAAAIAKRCGMSEVETQRILETMADKGLIWKLEGKGKPLFMAVQYVVGFLEETLLQRIRQDTMERDLARLWEESIPDVSRWWESGGTKQLRVVPVGAAVDATRTVAPYDCIKKVVSEQTNIAVAPCICKQVQGVLGKKCERPVETCLGFGYVADHWVGAGLGRKISSAEALKVLERAEESAMVLQPNNAEELLYLCCCCSCCCGVIHALRIMERPADQVHSSFQARIDADLCDGCGTCLERCQIDALVEGEEAVAVDPARCIGCGLCLSFCPEQAISMVPKQTVQKIPSTYLDAITRMAGERGQPLSQLNRMVKKTTFSRYVKQWEVLHRLHVAEPLINMMARRGWA